MSFVFPLYKIGDSRDISNHIAIIINFTNSLNNRKTSKNTTTENCYK